MFSVLSRARALAGHHAQHLELVRLHPDDGVGRMEDLRLAHLLATYVARTIENSSQHQTISFALRPVRPAVLFCADMLHPVRGLSFRVFLNRDVRHRGRRRCAVPVLFTRRKPDHVAWPDFLDRAAETVALVEKSPVRPTSPMRRA